MQSEKRLRHSQRSEPDIEEKWSVERGTEVERIVYFSDRVFAITLLALGIRVPDRLLPRKLTAALVEM